MSQAQKIPFPSSLSQFLQQRIEANQQAAGQIYPCHVTKVNGAIVTVNFDVDAGRNTTLPAVTCPVIGSIYIRVPIQVGDFGICISASTRLGGVTGLGSGLAPLLNPSNLGGLVFVPIGNSNWLEVDANAVIINGPNGVVLRDTDSETVFTLTPSGLDVIAQTSLTLEVGNNSIVINSSGITITGNLSVTGTIVSTGNVTAGAISLETHEHNVVNVQSGTSTIPTSAPF